MLGSIWILVTSTRLSPHTLKTMSHMGRWSHCIIRLSTVVVSTRVDFVLGSRPSQMGLFQHICISFYSDYHTNNLHVWIFMLCFCTCCLDPGDPKKWNFNNCLYLLKVWKNQCYCFNLQGSYWRGGHITWSCGLAKQVFIVTNIQAGNSLCHADL